MTKAGHGQVFFQASGIGFSLKEPNHTLLLHRAGHQPRLAGP